MREPATPLLILLGKCKSAESYMADSQRVSISVLVAFRTNFEKQLARKVKIQEARPKPESKWRDEASVATHRLRWGLHARRPKRARWRSRACLSSLFLFFRCLVPSAGCLAKVATRTRRAEDKVRKS